MSTKKANKFKIGKVFSDIITGNILVKDGVVKNMQFIFFITGLLVLYIAYGYYTENRMRKLSKIEVQSKELESELHSSLKELNEISLQSNIAKRSKEINIYELETIPFKIEVEKEELEH